jgi:hypothetical protein
MADGGAIDGGGAPPPAGADAGAKLLILSFVAPTGGGVVAVPNGAITGGLGGVAGEEIGGTMAEAAAEATGSSERSRIGLAAAGLGAICCNNALAFCVPSTPQTGQLTVNGIRPLTGSTSNLYF